MNDSQEITTGTAPAARAGTSSNPKHKNHWPFLAIGLVLLLGGIGAIWWRLQPASTVHYLTQAATRGPVTRTIVASGTVNPVIVVQVGTYVSGVVQKRFCDYNTEVKAGQLCAKIDPRPYESVVAQNRANLAVAKAQLEKDTANLTYTKVSFERNQALAPQQAVSKDVLDSSKSLYEQAQAQIGLDQANIQLREAELQAVEVNLDYTNIRSPVDGTVISRNVEMGQTVESWLGKSEQQG